VPLVGRVQGRDLPGQVVITGPGGELVQTHRHVSLSPVTSAQWSPPGGYIPAVHQVCRTSDSEIGCGGTLNRSETNLRRPARLAASARLRLPIMSMLSLSPLRAAYSQPR
jgi:hypothetical protein